MTNNLNNTHPVDNITAMEELKKRAARKALEYVESGMRLGLGSGSTSRYFVQYLGEALQAGTLTNIVGVPTSIATEKQALGLGIPLVKLTDITALDLAVDGADDVDPQLNLIKGLGNALVREKVVESYAKELIIIVDESKIVDTLGTRSPLPVEIIRFESDAHVRRLADLGSEVAYVLDEHGERFISDNGNYIVRCRFPAGIADSYGLATTLQAMPGIVEHGMFLDMTTKLIIAGQNGIELQEKSA